MTILKIIHTVTYEVRVEEYIRAAVLAEEVSLDEIDPNDYEHIARRIAEKEEEDELVPRWARESLDVIEQHTTIHERTNVRVVSEWQEIGGFLSDNR